MGLKLNLIILSIFYLIYSSFAGNVSFSNCLSTSTFTVSRVSITDAVATDQCSTSGCTIISGHTYNVEFDGCSTNVGNITNIPFNINATVLVDGVASVPQELKGGDLCSYFAPSSTIKSCPVQTPACATFAFQILAPLGVSLPPIKDTTCPGTITGHAWKDVTGLVGSAAICIEVPFTYTLSG